MREKSNFGRAIVVRFPTAIFCIFSSFLMFPARSDVLARLVVEFWPTCNNLSCRHYLQYLLPTWSHCLGWLSDWVTGSDRPLVMRNLIFFYGSQRPLPWQGQGGRSWWALGLCYNEVNCSEMSTYGKTMSNLRAVPMGTKIIRGIKKLPGAPFFLESIGQIMRATNHFLQKILR